MKKSGRTNKTMVSKHTYQIAKSASLASGESAASKDQAPALINNHPFEDNLMGDNRGGGSKSEAMDKNLNQMFDVLRLRLKTLDEVTTTRKHLSSQDPLENSNQKSDPTSKIVDEFDEAIPRSLRDTRLPTMVQKDNLVSSDGVYIDPVHMVFSKQRAPTEAAKKLESTIEESLGNVNLREMKSKKSKLLNQTEKSKKSEQLKNEAKRIARLKLEKQLQAVMDDDKTVVTRSVMDTDQILVAPENLNMQIEFPIMVKWSSRDPRSADEANSEGQFDPDLLLRYAIERMTLPSGKKLFAWLVRQPVVHTYLVHIFWFIKTKFFDTVVKDEVEAYLLRQLSVAYKVIIELLASRTNAEHEKDFVFKYFPFILTNGVYFAFFYLHPGSRHLYTRGFKKTIYMQIVQVMHGIQLCTSSVKVSWQKLFPDDGHDDAIGATAEAGEGSEDVAESFPILMALKGPKGSWVHVQSSPSEDAMDTIDASNSNRQLGSPSMPLPDNNFGINITVTSGESFPEDGAVKFPGTLTVDDDGLYSASSTTTSITAGAALLGAGTMSQSNPAIKITSSVPDYAHDATAGFTRPRVSKGRLKGGFAGNTQQLQAIQSTMTTSKSEPSLGRSRKTLPTQLYSDIDANSKLTAKALASLVGIAGISRPSNARSINYAREGSPQAIGSDSHAASAFNLPTGRASSPRMTRFARNGQSFPSAVRTVNLVKSVAHLNAIRDDDGEEFDANKTATELFADEPKVQSVLYRTYMHPPIEKPSNPKLISKRQNHHERLGAQQKSPQMQLYLSRINGNAAANEDYHSQSFQRTLPISWCAAGGTDTHKKQVINTELHNEISAQLRKSVTDQYQQAIEHHKNKIQTRDEIKKSMLKVLASGATNISRFNLDLIRRQRAMRGANGATGHGATSVGGGNVGAGSGNIMKESLVGQNVASGGGGGAQQLGTMGISDSSELDMTEIQRLADYDDDELEEWLRDF